MEERIIELMKDVLETQDIDINSTQETIGNWTSLRHLSLASELEDEFGIEFDPAEIAEMKSVRQIADILRSLI